MKPSPGPLAILITIAIIASLIAGCAQPSVKAAGENNGSLASASPVPTVSPAPSPAATDTKAFSGWPGTGNKSADFFIDVVLAPYSQGNRTPVVRRWLYDTDVDIYLAGQPTDADREAVQACADEINGMRTDYGDIYIDLVDSESMANVIIYLGPAGQFSHYFAYYDPYKFGINGIRPSAGDYDLQNGGFKVWYDYETVPARDRGNSYAVIALPDTGIDQVQRSRFLWRGIAAILGAHGSSPLYADSLFADSSGGEARFSHMDREVIQKLIIPRGIGPGMTYDMVVQVMVYHKTWEEAVHLGEHAATFT